VSPKQWHLDNVGDTNKNDFVAPVTKVEFLDLLVNKLKEVDGLLLQIEQ